MLGFNSYAGRLLQTVTKQLGPAPGESATVALCKSLHTDDLYLSTACAQNLAKARASLQSLYSRQVLSVALSACSSKCAGQELADSILGHLFLPDRSGRARIASYDGRSSLATWLAAVINHKAIQERRHQRNNHLAIDCAGHLADDGESVRIEASLRSHECKTMLGQALERAASLMDDRDRLILLLRHEDGLSGNQIAALLEVHPSTVTRRLHCVLQLFCRGASI
jgi:RNA polymerase sigma-70 factor